MSNGFKHAVDLLFVRQKPNYREKFKISRFCEEVSDDDVVSGT